MARIEANGLGFEVSDEGAGIPVVLLHGFPDTSVMWRHQVAALTAAGFRTIAPDMRGRGRSDRPPEVADYALTKIVGDVIGIMDALGVGEAHLSFDPLTRHDGRASSVRHEAQRNIDRPVAPRHRPGLRPGAELLVRTGIRDGRIGNGNAVGVEAGIFYNKIVAVPYHNAGGSMRIEQCIAL